jgi:flagellar hook-associated protein 3 FlgL
MSTDRITPAMISANTLNDLNATLSQLQRSSEEMSSGRQILAPSDNPYGASHAIDLKSQLGGLEAYASSVQDGISWTQAATGAMSNIGNILQRVRELLVQASNGTAGASDLAAIGSEVTQLTEAVKQDADTQYAGQYVFAGTATTTAPYEAGANDEYKGNNGSVVRTAGPGTNIAVNAELDAALGNGQAAGDGKLLDVLRTIAQHMQEGTPASREALSTSDMKNLDNGMEALTQVEALSGSATTQLQTASARIESLHDSIAQALSGTEDADFSKVTTNFSNEQAAYSAALRAAASIVQESLLNFLR